jgi:hypothetical protein
METPWQNCAIGFVAGSGSKTAWQSRYSPAS